ncbi:hypothetical protein ACIQUU_14340 [Streptomyces sp. NPDC101116]
MTVRTIPQETTFTQSWHRWWIAEGMLMDEGPEDFARIDSARAKLR